jgi:aspartate/methionine/tyrosine aminotransferase
MRDIHDYCVQNNIYSLSQGMIEIAPPTKLTEIANTFLSSPEHESIHTYRRRFGEEDYIAAIHHILVNQFKVNLTKDHILAISGVTGGIVSTMNFLKRQGKARIGLVEPFYTYHVKQAALVWPKENIFFIPGNEDLSVNLETIKTSIQQNKLDAILLCNPGNPSGLVLPKAVVKELLKLTAELNCFVIFDECYCDFVWTEEGLYSPIQEDTMPEHVAVIRGFSKSLGLQSWRMGYLVATPQNVNAIMAEHDPVYISLSWLQHALAAYVTNHFDDYTTHLVKVRDVMRTNWNTLSPVIERKMGWKAIQPEGSMYGCFKHSEATDLDAVLKGIEAGFGVAPGTIFYGGPVTNTGFIRIHCGVSKTKASAIADILSK